MTLREACTKTNFLPGLVAPSGEAVVPEGLHLVEGTYAGAVHGELQPIERTHISWRTVSCGRDHGLERGMSVRKKEQRRTCNELTAPPFPNIENSWEEGRGSGG